MSIDIGADDVAFSDLETPCTVTIPITNRFTQDVEIRAKTTHPSHIVTKPNKVMVPADSHVTIDVVYKSQTEPKLDLSTAPRIQLLWITPDGTEQSKKLKVKFGAVEPRRKSVTNIDPPVNAHPLNPPPTGITGGSRLEEGPKEHHHHHHHHHLQRVDG